MNIPEGLGTFKSIQTREKKAFAEMSKWEDILDDAYEFFLPQRNLFNREGRGQKKMDRIFDSTAIDSIKQGASKLQENIAPIWSRWANFEPSTETLRLLDDVDEVSEADIRENLEEQAEIVFDVINRSNFGTQFYEFALDLLIGTATMTIDEDESEEMPVIYRAIPQIGLAFEEGSDGSVNTHFFRMKCKARNIEQKWKGFEVSSELAKIIEKSPDEDVNICQAVIFNQKDKIYYALVWVKEEEKISWVQNYPITPMVTSRYAKASGEVRGRGPALDVLPDVRSLNKAKEFVLTKAAIDLSGIWTATDDGATNPYNIKIAPGVVLPVGSNNTSNPTLARLDTGADINLSLFEIEELKSGIKRSLFSEVREPDDSVISATQYSIEARELAKRIGSAFGRLQTEALTPILKATHEILKRRGLVQGIVIGGREVSIKFTSPLARAQDAEDLSSIQQSIEFTRAVAGDDAVKMSFKLEDIGKYASDKTGMTQELVRSDAERGKVIQAGADAVKAGMVQNEL